jgi:hypothetical protein
MRRISVENRETAEAAERNGFWGREQREEKERGGKEEGRGRKARRRTLAS